jgi:hypothetical protein
MHDKAIEAFSDRRSFSNFSMTQNEACREWYSVRLATISKNARFRAMAACVVSALDTEGSRHTLK